MDSAEIKPLTGLRAFAALLVLLLHFNQAIPGHNFADDIPLIFHGHLGVDIFFMLSGFIITHVYGERLETRDLYQSIEFIRNRIARLMPAHLVALVAVVALWAIALMIGRQFNHPENWNLRHLPLNALMLQAWFVEDIGLWNGPSWSISAELFAYLTFPVFFPAIIRLVRAELLASLLCLLIIIIYGVIGLDLATSFLGWRAILRVMLEFWLGVALYILWGKANIFRAPYIFYGSVAGFLLAPSLNMPEWAMIIFTAAIIATARGAEDPILSHDATVFVGKISYSIYIVHYPVNLILMQLYNVLSFNDKPYLMQLIWYGASIMAAGSAGFALFFWVEEPGRRWVRARFPVLSSVG